ncbi:hypothetical protein [Bernardetia sp. MNP-M8]|uniref:hypothetical protein n=1 Tax=Bernardetia sp. MNP-M8 TaxID=3127470 RepID=UPI0030D02365
MSPSKKQIQDKINSEKFKALQDLKQVELRLFESNKTDFVKWLELTEFLEKLKEAEYDLIYDQEQELQDLELSANFETIVKEIVENNFEDKFQAVFADYLDKEVEKALAKFLTNKGLMGVMIHLRNHMDAESHKLKMKLLDAQMDWIVKNQKTQSLEESMHFMRMTKQIERVAEKRLDEITEEFIESLDTKTLQEAATSIQLSESLIKSVMQFVFERVQDKLNIILEEYKTVSLILQENIKKKIMEKE